MAELRTYGVPTFVARLPELLDVYRRAFLEVYESDPEQATGERRALMQQHRYRPGLRLATFEDEKDKIVGFCYSYHGTPGHWWHDVVFRALNGPDRAEWLSNCREIVELHGLPDYQGQGLGRQLLRAALADSSETTAVLSALDIEGTRAMRLYGSEGFRPLLSRFQFPGTATRYVILGKELTTADATTTPTVGAS